MSKVNKPATPATVLSFNATALTETQQRTLLNLEQKELFVRHGRSSGKADGTARHEAKEAAIAFMALWTREAYADDWTSMDARILPTVAKEWHACLIDGLKADQHPAPNMVWKRIREQGAPLMKAAMVAGGAGGDGGDGEVEVESAREKVRRLVSEDLQSIYTRIHKAQDIDRDVHNLLPEIRKLAVSIKLKLREPDQK
jgi:hypothetical protein